MVYTGFHSGGGGGISGWKRVCWEYLTASMQNFKSGVDSRRGRGNSS